MKLKMHELQLFADAINTMKQSRTKGMNRYLFDVSAILEKDADYYNQELKAIQKEHAQKDEKGAEIKNEQGLVLLNVEGQKLFYDLLQEESGDYPMLTVEQGKLLEDYPFIYGEYAIMQRLIKEVKEEGV